MKEEDALNLTFQPGLCIIGKRKSEKARRSSYMIKLWLKLLNFRIAHNQRLIYYKVFILSVKVIILRKVDNYLVITSLVIIKYM